MTNVGSGQDLSRVMEHLQKTMAFPLIIDEQDAKGNRIRRNVVTGMSKRDYAMIHIAAAIAPGYVGMGDFKIIAEKTRNIVDSLIPPEEPKQ